MGGQQVSLSTVSVLRYERLRAVETRIEGTFLQVSGRQIRITGHGTDDLAAYVYLRAAYVMFVCTRTRRSATAATPRACPATKLRLPNSGHLRSGGA